MNTPRAKPQILSVHQIAHSRLFTIESVDLRFSNGQQRQFERMKPVGRHAVMIVPIQGHDLLLIREYAVGIESYELTFPKGLIDPNESLLAAADRELMEEVGFGAGQLTPLRSLTIAPAYFCSEMTIVLAQHLYPQTRPGDEPEPLEVVRWPIKEMMHLLDEPAFTEARCISALFLTKNHLHL